MAQREKVIVGGTGDSPVADAFGEQGDGFTGNEVADRLGCCAGSLSVGEDERESSLWSFDHFESVAAFAGGIFTDFCCAYLNLHGVWFLLLVGVDRLWPIQGYFIRELRELHELLMVYSAGVLGYELSGR